MSAWHHPTLGPIELIPRNLCAKKVWQHFYDAHEHWERLCDVDVAALRLKAENLIGTARANNSTLPQAAMQHRPQARDLLVSHHDSNYAPAYSAELASPETVWTSSMDRKWRHHALTPRAVVIVVQLDRPKSWIVTAFRPHPPISNVIWSEADLRRHGISYFRRETDVNVSEFSAAVADNLRRASKPPSSAKELWWLASATGYARLLRNVPEVRDALPAAEAALSGTPGSLFEELRRTVDWAHLGERLADALKESRPEVLEGVLADAEELLAVASVVGAESMAVAFCDEAEMLLPWLPAEWAHIADRARHRMQVTAAQPSPLVRLWTAVEDAATAALVREATPSVRPVSRLADVIIPQQPWWLHWQNRISDLATRASTALTTWVEQSVAGLTMAAPAPTMGGSKVANVEWEVHGIPAPGAPHHRVFVVDSEHPDGHEVTQQFTESDGGLWRLNAGEQALVVIVAGTTPLVGGSLAQVLKETSNRDDAVARARVLQPTHATKARR